MSPALKATVMHKWVKFYDSTKHLNGHVVVWLIVIFQFFSWLFQLASTCQSVTVTVVTAALCAGEEEEQEGKEGAAEVEKGVRQLNSD